MLVAASLLLQNHSSNSIRPHVPTSRTQIGSLGPEGEEWKGQKTREMDSKSVF